MSGQRLPWHRSHLLELPNKVSNQGLIAGNKNPNNNLSYMQMIIGEKGRM